MTNRQARLSSKKAQNLIGVQRQAQKEDADGRRSRYVATRHMLRIYGAQDDRPFVILVLGVKGRAANSESRVK